MSSICASILLSKAIARAFFFALHGQRCRDDTEHFAKHRSDSKQKCVALRFPVRDDTITHV